MSLAKGDKSEIAWMLLQRLAKTESAEEQAQLIVEHKIPYTTAIGSIKHVTPALLVALINAMSPQEVINNMAALKRRGALDDKDVKALIEQKIAESATDKRVADKVEIKRPTTLFVDKSSSMTQAIDVAKQLAALVSAVISADFRVYAFDSVTFDVKSEVTGDRRPALSDWEKAFKFIKANGSTSIGSALAKMTHDSIYAETIVIVTDEGENTAPYFRDAYSEYVDVMKVAPSVVIVQVGGENVSFVTGLQGRGIEVMRYKFSGDLYSLPNILPLLAMPTKSDLVGIIMDYALPQRPKQA